MTERPRPLEEACKAIGLELDQALDLAQRGRLRLFCLAADLPLNAVGWTTRKHIVHGPRIATDFSIPSFEFAEVIKLGAWQDWRQLRDGATVNAIGFKADLPAVFPLEEVEHTEHPEGGMMSHRTGETIQATGPLEGHSREGVALARGNLWVFPSELARRAKRPRLLEDATRDAGCPIGDALDAVATGRLRVMIVAKAHLDGAVWTANSDQHGASFIGLTGPRRPLPPQVEFAFVDRPEEGSDVRALAVPGGTIRAKAFEAVDVEPFYLDGGDREYTGVSVFTREPVSLTLADLWAMPDDVAALRPAREQSERAPRHERELLLCIGALAKLLAEHAPSTTRFGGSKKSPFNQTKIGEAVEREAGLNSKTVAGWLGEAKKLLDERDDDPGP